MKEGAIFRKNGLIASLDVILPKSKCFSVLYYDLEVAICESHNIIPLTMSFLYIYENFQTRDHKRLLIQTYA